MREVNDVSKPEKDISSSKPGKPDHAVSATEYQKSQTSHKNACDALDQQIKNYGSVENWMKFTREKVEESNAPLKKEFWIDLGCNRGQAKINADVVSVVKPIIESQAKDAGVNLRAAWTSFGAMKKYNDSLQGEVGKELQASNEVMVEEAVKELKGFKIPKELKSPETFWHNFAKNRMLFGFDAAINNALENEEAKNDLIEKKAEPPEDKPPEDKPPKDKPPSKSWWQRINDSPASSKLDGPPGGR